MFYNSIFFVALILFISYSSLGYQFLKIEDPVRRKVQTASVIGKNNTRGFELSPPEVDMGVLKEGHTYVHSVILRNIGIDSCRFKVRQPPPSTGIKVLFNHGPVSFLFSINYTFLNTLSTAYNPLSILPLP